MLLAIVVLIGMLVWAPAIVALRPLRDMVLTSHTEQLPVEIQCQRLRLAWWRPVQISGLRIVDDDDQMVAEIDSIQTDRTLLELVLDRTTVGTVRVEKPTLHVHLTAQGSNLESLVARVSRPDNSQSSPSGSIEVVNATVNINDGPRDSSWTIHAHELQLSLPPSAGESFQLKANGEVMDDGRRGRFDFTASLVHDTPPGHVACVADIECEQLPLVSAQSWLARQLPGIHLGGTLSGQAHIAYGDEIAARGDLQLNKLELRAPMLEDDRLNLEQATLGFDFAHVQDRLRVKRFDLQSDLGHLQVDGELYLADTISVWRAALRDGKLNARGEINIAALASKLPSTLRVRQDIQVTKGRAVWSLALSADGDIRTIQGQLLADDVMARQDGRDFSLTDPVDVEFQVIQSPEGWRVQQLVGRSTFLAFSAQGDSNRGQFAGRADLQSLHRELGRFIDLTDVHLAGRCDAHLRWDRANDQVKAVGQLRGNDLSVRLSDDRAWNLQTARASMQATGRLKAFRLDELTSAQFELVADGDKLTAQLTEPTAGLRSDLRVSLIATGDLASWRDRIDASGFVELPPMAGKLHSTAEVRLTEHAIDVVSSDATIDQLEVTLAGRRIREPRVQLNCVARWDRRTAELTTPETTISATSFSVRAWDVRLITRAPDQAARGQFSYRADVGQMWPHVRPAGQPNLHRPTGQLVGQLTAVHDHGKTRFETSNQMTDFTWLKRQSDSNPPSQSAGSANQWSRIWFEPRVRITATGALAHDLSTVEFEQLRLNSNSAEFNLAGMIDDLTNTIHLRLEGQSKLQLDKLSARLAPLWGNQLRLEGSTTQPIEINGPLREGGVNLQMVSAGQNEATSWIPRELQAEAAVHWDRAHAWGFQIDAATVSAQLTKQTLLIRGADLGVSGGRIHLAPRIRLTQRPMIVLDQGRVVDQVALTPEICDAWLKYVAPLMANVTQAQGRFSLDLESARMPAAQPGLGNVQGSLNIHSGQVGPSPTTQRLLVLIQQIRSLAAQGSEQTLTRTWIDVPQQAVPFRMSQGRIEHQRMTMVIGGVPIRTSGWVSLNQRMSLVAEIPIQASWIGNNRWLAGLKDQSIQVPIEGSLRNPQVDANVLRNLTRRSVTDAAEGVLQDELQRQLNRLFK